MISFSPVLFLPEGMDISPIDLINIESFSSRVVSLTNYRQELQEYLRSKMGQVAPNLAALIGDVVCVYILSYPKFYFGKMVKIDFLYIYIH